MVTCISKNCKTFKSVDLSSICPRRETGNQCPYCVTGDTKILMEDYTYKQIRDIKVGDKIIGFPENGRMFSVSSMVTGISPIRESEVYLLRTSGGKEIKITEEHPIKVQLNCGELKWRSIANLDAYVKGIKTTTDVLNSVVDRISYSKTNDYKIGYFIGSILGDGHMWIGPNWSYRLRFTVKDAELFDYVRSLFDTFGIRHYIGDFKLTKNDIYPCIFANYKESYLKAEQIIEDNFAINKTEAYACGFLAGAYDCEGNFENARIFQSIKNRKGYNYLVEVKNCLNLLGINYTLEENHDRKQHFAKSIRINTSNSNFLYFLLKIENKILRKSYHQYNEISSIFDLESIESISPIGKQLVYNIETTSHTYIANGICVHNCYTEVARKIGSCRAKKEYDRINYKGEVLRMQPQTIEMIKKCGGLRLFSFGDYKPWMDEDLEKVINDAHSRDIPVKAITKVSVFVEKFADKVDIINVSIDSVGYGVPWDTAKKLRDKYPNVYIRAAILSKEDIKTLGWVDIMTLNHGFNKFYHFSKQEKAEIFAAFPDKMCCITGKCFDCKIKCRGIK